MIGEEVWTLQLICFDDQIYGKSDWLSFNYDESLYHPLCLQIESLAKYSSPYIFIKQWHQNTASHKLRISSIKYEAKLNEYDTTCILIWKLTFNIHQFNNFKHDKYWPQGTWDKMTKNSIICLSLKYFAMLLFLFLFL